MVPLIKMEVVENFHWMTADEFGTIYAMGNALPGPVATKMAGYVGFKVAGLAGSLVALLGVAGPSLIAMILLYKFLSQAQNIPQVAGMIKGIKPVVIVLLALLILELWPTSFAGWTQAAIAILGFAAIKFLHVHPIVVVVAALAFGAVALR